ncbi:hypothetical protein AB9P05_00080 [Roseivirga sp. BDSF3-8]|uniref:hypothetical protein n=1 Tax=Roseivirga sp. BDSF3-8 TaxID=3241598 RepID=UPI0035327F20
MYAGEALPLPVVHKRVVAAGSTMLPVNPLSVVLPCPQVSHAIIPLVRPAHIRSCPALFVLLLNNRCRTKNIAALLLL